MRSSEKLQNSEQIFRGAFVSVCAGTPFTPFLFPSFTMSLCFVILFWFLSVLPHTIAKKVVGEDGFEKITHVASSFRPDYFQSSDLLRQTPSVESRKILGLEIMP